MERDLPIIMYSPLRWDSMFQREQQLLSRVAAQQPVYFFEEALAAGKQVPDSIELRYPLANLVVIRPILEKFSGPFDPERLTDVAQRFLRWQLIEQHIAWICAPLAEPLARALLPERVVYGELQAAFPTAAVAAT